MKSKITCFWMLLCLCFGINNNFAQHDHHGHHHNFQHHQINESETPTYKRIKVIINNQDDLDGIAGLGIDLHCGANMQRINGQDVLTLEVQESDYENIKNRDFQPEVLVDDLSNFYAERNTTELPIAQAALIQAKQNALLKNAEVGQDIGCTEDQFPVPQNFDLGSMGGFTTYQEMLDELDQMRSLYPNLISVKAPASTSINTSQGRTIYYVRLSDNPDVDENEAEVLYTGVHHAREPLSMMNHLYYMWYLLENYATDQTVRNIVDNTEMYFIPVVNADGYVYNQQTNPNGGGMWRKNRRNNGDGTTGVDPNRNYGYQWGLDDSGSSPTSSSDTYRGTAPFSEPETQIIRNFVQSHSFVNAFNTHAYSNLMLHPWGHTANPSPDEELLGEISEHMCWHNRYHYGNGNEVIYPTNGDADDWFYGAEDILAWTPEIGSAAEGGFWPSASDIVPQCQEQLKMSLILAYSAANYGVLNDLTPYRLDPQNPELTFSVEHMSNVNGAFTISVSSSSPYVTSIANSTMNTGTITDANFATVNTAVTIDPNTPPGTVIDFDVVLNNGTYDIHTTTISKMYSAYELLYDNASSLSNWTSSGGWGVSGAGGYLDGNSLTDSPSGDMSTATRTLTLTNPIDLSGTQSAILEYYTKWDITRLFDFVQIEVSTDGSSWSELCGTYTKPGTSPDNIWSGNGSPDQPTGEGLYDGFQKEWVREQFDLSAYAGTNTVYLRFVADGDTERTQSDGFYFDDFTVYREPLGHCENGVQDADETNVDCGGVDCLACPTCTDGIQNGNETGIDCGGNCGVCPVCPTSISNFPYTEGFESGLGQWSQSGGDDLDWTRDSGGTPSNNTGPSSAYEGTWYMYIEASNPNFPSKTAGLVSPCFDLTGMQTASLSFQYHMYGTAADMDLDVQISTDGGASWSSAIWSQTGDQGNQWNSVTVNLDAYAGQYAMLRFWGTTGDGWQGDIAIDDIGFDAAPPACTPGTACDDGDACTVGEVYDANCQCNDGTLVDSDNDGVCDSNDQCSGTDDAVIGTACDDGDPNTINDVFDNNCNCAGHLLDITELQIGDPGVVFDQSLIDANQSCYPQMQRWSEAGVIGGVPFLNDFDQTAVISQGNSSTINDAINAMSNSLSGNQKGLITLSNGTYTIDNKISMKSNVSLKGQSRDGVVCNITMTSGNAFEFDGISYAGIYELTIQGSWGTPYYNWNYGIDENDELPDNDNISVKLFNDANNCWLDKVTILNSAKDPVRCNGPHNTLRDLYVDGAHKKAGGAQGYFFIQNRDNLVTGCYITHLRHISLQGGNVEYNVVYDNDFDQEVSFHTGDNGNNLIENNRITLPYDMPPVAPGDADAVTPVEARRDAPIYFAIMGPWSTQHTNSANPNYIINNQCLQQNHDFGSNTPWSESGKVYSGPLQLGLSIEERIENFPLVSGSCQNPSGSTLYPVQLDVCPGTNGASVGTTCDDGDPCTTGDVYDSNCNCAGTIQDADADGVCDANDICAAGDDNADADGDGTPDACDNCDDTLVGTACDDGNACTTGETYDANCNCTGGTIQDTDSDGVCDADDACPGTDDALAGTTCDDGDACTNNDVYDANCNCAGTLADTDGDGVCDANDACPGIDDALAGTACDDGNVCTIGETYDANCNCTGGTITDSDNDGTCDAQDTCPNDPTDSCNLTYCDAQGTNTTYEFIQSVELNSQTNNSGSDGGYGDYTATTLATLGSTNNITLTPGFASTAYAENWAVWIDFNKDGDFDDAGEQVYTGTTSGTAPTSGTFSAPSGIGTTTMRVAMVYNATPTPCGSFTYGEVEDYKVALTTPCTPGTACDDGDACTTGETYDSSCNCTGGTLVDSDNDGVCDTNDACPGVDDALAGTTCDDGDACTTGDVYDSNCNCAGTIADSDGDGVCDADDICGAGDDNADADSDGTPDACDTCDNTLTGTTCDDGDACTTGETYDANCNCTGGTVQDTDGDGVCDANDVCPGMDDALAGTACDDGDACTENDVYDANCNCAGTIADTDGDGICDANDACPGVDDALAGTACDDGDACTTGETYDANCNCTGGTVQDTDGDGVCDANDVCPGMDDALAGTACDDGDACTENDVYDSNCNCAGTIADTDGDGVCDANDACPGMDDALVGTACDDGNACTTGEIYDANCNCTGGTVQDSDNDGVCDADDICPNGDDNVDTDGDNTPDDCDECPNDANNACGTPPTYCTASSTDTNYEYIQQVVFGTINNASGNNGGYGDFTAQTTNAGLGSSVPISLTPGFASSSYSEAWKVWIDFNRDGDFDDAGEEVYTGTSTSTLSGNVAIPSTASLGLTGMRVAMQWNNAPSSPCGTFQYGEVEDYTVNITSAPIQLTSGSFNGSNFAVGSSLNLYPNPASSELNINLNEVLDMSVTEEINVIIYSLDGKRVYQNQTGLTDVLNINIEDLPNNQPYLLRLQTNDGEVFTGKFVKL